MPGFSQIESDNFFSQMYMNLWDEATGLIFTQNLMKKNKTPNLKTYS